MPPADPAPVRYPFAYTVIRVMPRVDRQEFINAGVVLYSPAPPLPWRADGRRPSALAVALAHARSRGCGTSARNHLPGGKRRSRWRPDRPAAPRRALWLALGPGQHCRPARTSSPWDCRRPGGRTPRAFFAAGIGSRNVGARRRDVSASCRFDWHRVAPDLQRSWQDGWPNGNEDRHNQEGGTHDRRHPIVSFAPACFGG